MKDTAREIGRFFGTHWFHVILAVPAALLYTALHELAHCAGVWLQGGEVTRFIWIPSKEYWGEMSYRFEPGSPFSDAAISIAPYVLWTALCVSALALSFRSKPWPFWAASSIFVWLFLAPIADTANSAMLQLRGRTGTDLYRVFGAPTSSVTMCFLGYGLAMAALGFFSQKNLYREKALSLTSFSVLGAIALFLIAGLHLLTDLTH